MPRGAREHPARLDRPSSLSFQTISEPNTTTESQPGTTSSISYCSTTADGRAFLDGIAA